MAIAEKTGAAHHRMDSDMADYSGSDGDDAEALSRDNFPVRSMRSDDLDALIRIDAKLTGHNRREYFQAKLAEVMIETGVRVSLVAEIDDHPAGFIMGRVDFGEFGRTETTAVIDTFGVDPGHGHRGIAHALLSQLTINLGALHVERIRTMVGWNNHQLLGFLEHQGFRPAQQLVLSMKI
mgnify:CR=1 FL=1